MPDAGAVYYTTVESPCGPVLVVGDEHAVRHVSFCEGRGALSVAPGWLDGSHGRGAAPRLLGEARRQLAEYFARTRREFSFPVAPQGTTFQQKVWRALSRIPYGKTVTYGELAKRIGRPTASRAVGAANGRNPVPVVIPCHRVIGAGGRLVGYAGGVDIKERLLRLER
jgi:methylated-DNA-[protein]-cysteine S-methyltransferase